METLSEHYELVIFTASLSQYADPLLDILDAKQLCSARLFREHCTHMCESHVKNLQLLGRAMKDVLIIDNSPNCFMLQPENAIPIKSWFDDPADTQLIELIPFLERLAFKPDVRPILKECVFNLKSTQADSHYIDIQKGLELVQQIDNFESLPSIPLCEEQGQILDSTLNLQLSKKQPGLTPKQKPHSPGSFKQQPSQRVTHKIVRQSRYVKPQKSDKPSSPPVYTDDEFNIEDMDFSQGDEQKLHVSMNTSQTKKSIVLLNEAPFNLTDVRK